MAAHVHSSWSYDGSWTLEQIARSFARRGYRAVLLSEHSQTFTAAKWAQYQLACAEASRPNLLLVPGIEYSDVDNVLHIPVWGAEMPFLGQCPEPRPLLEGVIDSAGVSVLAHPGRREAWRRVDPEWISLLSGIEIWNRKYDGWSPNSAAVDLVRDEKLSPFVTLDFHTRRQFFPLAMRATVPDRVTPAAIYAALRQGECRPEMLRLPVSAFTSGPLALAARSAELARGRTMAGLRAAIRRAGSVRR